MFIFQEDAKTANENCFESGAKLIKKVFVLVQWLKLISGMVASCSYVDRNCIQFSCSSTYEKLRSAAKNGKDFLIHLVDYIEVLEVD